MILINYTLSGTAITCTSTSLASDTNLLAGRQSNVVDNTTVLACDAMLGGTIATTSTPTANTVIEVWIAGSWDGGTTFSAAFASGGDANFAPVAGNKILMAIATVIQQTDTTARTYTLGPISIAGCFNGVMPQKWGFYVVHNTGQTLGATTMKYTNISYSNA